MANDRDPLNFPTLTAGESLSFQVTWKAGATVATATPDDAGEPPPEAADTP